MTNNSKTTGYQPTDEEVIAAVASWPNPIAQGNLAALLAQDRPDYQQPGPLHRVTVKVAEDTVIDRRHIQRAAERLAEDGRLVKRSGDNIPKVFYAKSSNRSYYMTPERWRNILADADAERAQRLRAAAEARAQHELVRRYRAEYDALVDGILDGRALMG